MSESLFSEKKAFLLDGAMGTMIQKMQLPKAEVYEQYNLTHPNAIQAIHKAYIDAGADILYANTFGASPQRMKSYGLDYEQIIQAGIANAKAAVAQAQKERESAQQAPKTVLTALDIGPLGVLMEPMGSTTLEEAYTQFSQMVQAGVKAGADLIVIETMSDLYEAKAALLAAKENSTLPVLVTMTFEENGRTFSGTPVEAAALTLSGLKADAVGINCSLGPDKLLPLLKRLRQFTNLPIAAKPNAGLPDPLTGAYHLSPEEFTKQAEAFLDAGVSILGGCCGTTPETIRKLRELIDTHPVTKREGRSLQGACSYAEIMDNTGVHAIGERINPTGKKRLQQALLEKDFDYIARMAIEQQEAGASMLDLNAGHPGVDEEEMLPMIVRKVQSVCPLPLLLDSSNPKALEKALRVTNGLAAINSVNGKQESMDAILPIAAKYGASLVALCLDENGIPQSAKERLAIAEKIEQEARKYNIHPERLWFDALTLTVSAQQEQAKETLQTIRTLHDQKGARTILGVSNISFGLPNRMALTRTFLAAALQEGLSYAIINPSQSDLMDTIAAFKVLNGQDAGCRDYITRFAQNPASGSQSAGNTQAAAAGMSSQTMRLQDAIYKGLPNEAARAAKDLLAKGLGEMEIAEQHLIKALDRVGADYEQNILYLPSLLQAASAAQEVFEVLKESMAAKDSQSIKQGPIILATVQGDVHDIGKNIVKTLLENYGFQVIDLGKDVDPQVIYDAVIQNQARLVGLSALMTTTLPSMEKTIALLHTLTNPPKIMVGGAVLTRQAAEEMGADFYGKDARASVQYAQSVFQNLKESGLPIEQNGSNKQNKQTESKETTEPKEQKKQKEESGA